MRTVASVNENYCSQCGLCIELCPEEAIFMKGTAVVDPDKCTACASCINGCPSEAISLSGQARLTAS